MKIFYQVILNGSKLSFPVRRFLLCLIDILIILSSFLFTHHILSLPSEPYTSLFLAGVIISCPMLYFTGQYRSLTKYLGSSTIYSQAMRNLFIVFLISLASRIFNFNNPTSSYWIIYWLSLTVSMAVVRIGLRDMLLNLNRKPSNIIPRIAIYGAGSAGAQLAASLRLAQNYYLYAFLDDNEKLTSRYLYGAPIISPNSLKKHIKSIDKIFLAIPSISSHRKKEILDYLNKFNLEVLIIPSLDDIASGKARIEQLRPVAVADLLTRQVVKPDLTLLNSDIYKSVIFVTGAGGSIGSELCRQILQLNPKRLILFDHSELNLYNINQELRSNNPGNCDIRTILGSTQDTTLIEKIFNENKVSVVLHAAAYKHVPLVESNPLSGIKNNVISTRILCGLSRKCGVSHFVLISTDKAVRPTNVMGATKRLAEIVVQANAEELLTLGNKFNSNITCFSIVRFGNVLASSGSVIPLLQKQIASGGPLTITDPEIIRYFMTIPEAALLVLQAAVMAKGGEVFLLEMGEPVKIKDLAEQLVNLSGLSMKTSENPQGDIEIIYTGLRPGEKLYEELLIDASSEPTNHPLIYRAMEKAMPASEVWPQLDSLEKDLNTQNKADAIQKLERLVPEFLYTKPN